MSAVWRCRICEGVNQGGRICGTCGTVVPPGENLRAAVRAVIPRDASAAPPPVPSTPRARQLRELPAPDEMADAAPDDLFASPGDFKMVPIPGGCLMVMTPRRSRPRSWEWR